jgi:hypothetical protein
LMRGLSWVVALAAVAPPVCMARKPFAMQFILNTRGFMPPRNGRYI